MLRIVKIRSITLYPNVFWDAVWFILFISPLSLPLVMGYIMLDRKEENVWKCLVYKRVDRDDNDI